MNVPGTPKKNFIYTSSSPNIANYKDKQLHISKNNSILANYKSQNLKNSTNFINRGYSAKKNLKIGIFENNFNHKIDITQTSITENYKSETFEDSQYIKSPPHDTAHISPGLANKSLFQKENYLKLKRDKDKCFSENFERKTHALAKTSENQGKNYCFYPRRIADTSELKQKNFEEDRQVESDISSLSGNSNQNGFKKLNNGFEPAQKFNGEAIKNLSTNEDNHIIISSTINKKKLLVDKSITNEEKKNSFSEKVSSVNEERRDLSKKKLIAGNYVNHNFQNIGLKPNVIKNKPK